VAVQFNTAQHATAPLWTNDAFRAVADRPSIDPSRVAAPTSSAAHLGDVGTTNFTSKRRRCGHRAKWYGELGTRANFWLLVVRFWPLTTKVGTSVNQCYDRAMPTTRALIHAPWSASKVSTALRCPRLFHFKYIERIPEPEVWPEARVGKAIHKALEFSLHGRPLAAATEEARAGLISEDEQAAYDRLAHGIAPFIERVASFRRRRKVARQLIEYSLAVREDGSATQFYSGDAYYRGILDAGYLFDDDTIALVDHKTGKRFGGAAGSAIGDQLDGYAVLAAASFRHVHGFWLGIHWISERTLEWGHPKSLSTIRETLTPTLFDNIEAAALAVDDGPRTNAGAHCERCSYRSLCPASREPRLDWYEYEDDEP
jgi:PD-(D/E)XK nuclease superfamily